MKLSKTSWYADTLRSPFTRTIDSADSWRLLRTMRADLALSFYMAYHFVAGLLLFPVASTLL
ncbi:unnamed protein product [Staurois parvus]|uniref:MFS transporter n=1 Tax=Staurois parvus TaxID=386267 RepID=A0ABN9DHM9_9NEOB|nr:unnamed protein product [Staurois parvus]